MAISKDGYQPINGRIGLEELEDGRLGWSKQSAFVQQFSAGCFHCLKHNAHKEVPTPFFYFLEVLRPIHNALKTTVS
ncbi:hypothetical protein AYI69_g6385 [Smittium culicis]|uniref:Uncharacterized protein n=1 Tax=Smittium culicis TaxID=133412 RepID=A0A1R1XZB2_9FUNG|nr:hypothetical protein AYI69_g6385 [Smittium culicis]